MTATFTVLEKQIEAPPAAYSSGRVVLSRLTPGESLIKAPAPSLKLVLEGEEVYVVDGRKIRVTPGQFLYLDAGEQCVALNRSYAVGLCLFVAPSAAGAPCSPDEATDPVLGRSVLLSARSSSMGRMLEDYGTRIARKPELGPMLAPQLVAEMSRAIEQPLAESRAAVERLGAAKLSTRRELYQRLEQARAFLHANDHRAVQLAELAQIAGLSQFHLARYFRAAFGKPPIAYHRDLRLARATALRESSLSLTEAAEASGYADASALSHALRRTSSLRRAFVQSEN